MNQNTQHRNKCQNCFKNVGKFILDCYCFLCIECFEKQRTKGYSKCMVCFKPTSGKFIDTRDQGGLNKVNHLFGSFETTLSRCMDIYRFQNDIDLRYIRFLECQLGRYKELLNNIMSENPRLKEYANNFFKRKATPYKSRSVSHSIQNHSKAHQGHPTPSRQDARKPRSLSNQSVEAYHERIVDPQPVRQGEPRRYTANVGYKMPSINYSTALRSSKRPNNRDTQDEEMMYYPPR